MGGSSGGEVSIKDEIQESGKSERILDIYSQLLDGKVVKKTEIAERYGVNAKSVQRDIESIRLFLGRQSAENGVENDVIYDYQERGYRLEHLYKVNLSNDEVLAICKILLDSRAFTKRTMEGTIGKLITCCVPPASRKMVETLIQNELFHYIPPKHNTEFLSNMWILGDAIRHSNVIEIEYQGIKGRKANKRRLEPLAILFSEFYFYLAGFIEDIDREKAFANPKDPFPTIYRIDRIKSITVLDEHYKIPYKDRFEAGEFRKRIQFMTGGRLRKIRFEYTGLSIEAVLDRLPTAKILKEEDGVYTVEAEVFGDGVDMWIRSQGTAVHLLSQ